jgi:hypothetical protein
MQKYQIFTGIAYNIAFFISWLFPTLNRFVDGFEVFMHFRVTESIIGGPAPYWMQIMQTLTGARSIGFFSFYCVGISRVQNVPSTLQEVKSILIHNSTV